MTDERKNEIWAMLPKWFKQEVIGYYDHLEDHAMYVREGAQRLILETLFGSHNLTAQAEENKEKIGIDTEKSDKFPIPTENGISKVSDETLLKMDENLRKFVEMCSSGIISTDKCTNLIENGISDEEIQSESAKSVETSVNYAKFRLELAKDVLLALIPEYRQSSNLAPVCKLAVAVANEIVKRLKETEE